MGERLKSHQNRSYKKMFGEIQDQEIKTLKVAISVSRSHDRNACALSSRTERRRKLRLK